MAETVGRHDELTLERLNAWKNEHLKGHPTEALASEHAALLKKHTENFGHISQELERLAGATIGAHERISGLENGVADVGKTIDLMGRTAAYLQLCGTVSVVEDAPICRSSKMALRTGCSIVAQLCGCSDCEHTALEVAVELTSMVSCAEVGQRLPQVVRSWCDCCMEGASQFWDWTQLFLACQECGEPLHHRRRLLRDCVRETCSRSASGAPTGGVALAPSAPAGGIKVAPGAPAGGGVVAPGAPAGGAVAVPGAPAGGVVVAPGAPAGGGVAVPGAPAGGAGSPPPITPDDVVNMYNSSASADVKQKLYALFLAQYSTLAPNSMPGDLLTSPDPTFAALDLANTDPTKLFSYATQSMPNLGSV